MKLLFPALSFLFFALAADAQSASNLSSYGSEFFVGFYEHVHTGITHILYVHTKLTTSVSFSISSLDGVFSYTGATTSQNPAAVTIPASYEVRAETSTYRDKGLRVASLETEPISVLAWSYRSAADYMSYLALPCHAQPTTEYTYYVVSTYGWSSQKSQFLIIGCKFNTTITITPNNRISVPVDPQVSSSPIVSIQPGSPYKFTLNSLQTFFVSESYVDLTGTMIVSDKPITIISGHEAAQVPTHTLDADPIVTQLTPTITWGKQFLLAPHYSRQNGQSYKILALNNMTSAVRTCASSSGNYNATNITFNANNTAWVYTLQGTYCSIIANDSIYVAQIGVSSNYAQTSSGDPALYTIPAIEQYEQEAQFTSFTQATGYYSVVVPNDSYFTNSLRINGFLQNITFIPIYASNGTVLGYGYSASTSGSNIISHTNSQGRLFVSVYGFTTYGGYGYPGSMMLNPINGGAVAAVPEVTFSDTEFTVNEGDGMAYVYLETNEAGLQANITIRLFSNPTTVDTALAGQDYSTFTTLVTFSGNETTKSVPIPIIDDDYAEPTQYFTISIESPTKDDITFPITEAVIKIIDNDAIAIGFLDSQFSIGGNGDLTYVNVGIVSGLLEPDGSSTFMLEIIIVEGENSSFISGSLSSFNPVVSYGFNLSQLSTYDPNNTNQSISALLSVSVASINVTLGMANAEIVPVVPFFPSSTQAFMSSSIFSSMMGMYSSSMVVCYTTGMEESSSMMIAPTSSSSIAIASSSSATTNIPISISIITISESAIMTTVHDTVTQTATVCPSLGNTQILSISTSTYTTTATVTASASACRPSNSSTPTRSSSAKTQPTPETNAFTEKIEVVGSALYFGIAIIIIAILVLLALSIFCCVFCYKRGHQKGRISEIKFDREIEMSGTNPLYDDPSDTMSYRSSVPSVDEKKLLQFMQ